MSIEPTTHRHKIGTCPACRCGLWAEFDVTVEVLDPRIDPQTAKLTATALPKFVAGRIDHHCYRDDDGEWTIGAPRQTTTHGADCATSTEPSKESTK